MRGALRRHLPGALGLFALVLVWWGIHRVWGPFVLPSPLSTAASVWAGVIDGGLPAAAADTAVAALGGFLVGTAVGAGLGLPAGLVPLFGRAVRPAVSVILSVPPIAWVVLSLLWFGVGETGPLVTTALTTFPIVFAAAARGAATLDPGLEEMARVFRAGPFSTFWDVRAPHVASHMAPALTTAHSIAWKSAVMAEVLAGGSGLGGRLASARTNLELPEAMAAVVAAVIAARVVEVVVLAPLGRRFDRGRPVVEPETRG